VAKTRIRPYTKLTPKQELFCQEYIIDWDGTRAYEKIYKCSHDSAMVGACKHLSVPKIKERLSALTKERGERTGLKADDALRECARIAMADVKQAFNGDGTIKSIHDIPLDLRRAISSFEVEEVYTGRGKARQLSGYIKKVKFWSKDKQLEHLFRHHGLFLADNEQRAMSVADMVAMGESLRADET